MFQYSEKLHPSPMIAMISLLNLQIFHHVNFISFDDLYSILLVQALHISGKFWNGDVHFTWDNTSQSYDEFYITRGDTIDRHDWQKSYNNSYLFRSVIRYPSVTITVYEALKGQRHNFTYKGNRC